MEAPQSPQAYGNGGIVDRGAHDPYAQTAANPMVKHSIVDEYTEWIELLAQRINDLEHRLGPIMRPDFDHDGDLAQPAPPISEARTQLDRLGYQSARLVGLLDRLEV